MSWYHQATSHYLSQCWPRYMSWYDTTRPHKLSKVKHRLVVELTRHPSITLLQWLSPVDVNIRGKVRHVEYNTQYYQHFSMINIIATFINLSIHDKKVKHTKFHIIYDNIYKNSQYKFFSLQVMNPKFMQCSSWWCHHIPVNSPHKGQWCGALMLSLICVWINGWVNNRNAGDLKPYRAHYDVI